MRYAIDAAGPVRYTLLGLLLAGPRHGYDLARCFAPGGALGTVVHLSPSHLYALLARLEREGLLSGERKEQPVRPARHIYTLTAAGREAVLRWVGEPVERPRDMHVAFPLKLYIACQLGPEPALALLDRQRAAFVAYLDQLAHVRAETSGTPDATFIALVQEGRIARTRAALEWLARCRDQLPALHEQAAGAMS